jgi:PAS domain S-box-containing protein
MLLSPAIAVMNRLKYPQKFALISLLFALPLALVMYFFVSEINDRIEFSRKEIEGDRYLRPLRGLLEHVVHSQIHAHDYSRRGLANRPELVRKQAEIDSNFKALAEIEHELGGLLKTSARHDVLQENGRFLRAQIFRLQPGESRDLHGKLIADIRALISHVGDTSNLILDPDLDSYYLMDAILLKLPDSVDITRRLWMLGKQVVEPGRPVAADEKANVIGLASLLRSNLDAVKGGMDIAFRNNPAKNLKPRLADPLAQYVTTAEQFLNMVDQDVINVRIVNIRTEAFDQAARQLLHGTFSFWDRTIVELDGLMQARIDGFVERRTLVLVVAGLTLLLVTYLFVAFYASVTGTVRNLEETTRRMVGGAIEERFSVAARDELGQVAASFNAIADRLRSEWTQAREDSARATIAEAQLKERTVALEQSERRTRLILDTALDAVVGMDAQGLITEWNPQAHAIFGWPREEALGKRLSDLIIPERLREAHESGLQKFMATNEGPVLNKRIEIDGLHRDGHEFPVELAISPVRSNGSVAFSAFVRDITARKQAEAELAQRNQELAYARDRAEDANRAKSTFLANMSHELRTPLNAIIGFSDVLLERMFGEMNPKQENYVRNVHSSGKHLLSLINDILDLSKIEAGRLELNLSDVHLPSALENAMMLVRERAQRQRIALTCDIDPQIGEIKADERKLKQIMLNLLSNAVKFTPEGGRVDVAARLVDGVVEIAVTDTGIGIHPRDHAAVFEEFRQVGRDYAARQEGTGLGLALTRSFVELHGGTLCLDSEPGRGSTFTFTLPVRR